MKRWCFVLVLTFLMTNTEFSFGQKAGEGEVTNLELIHLMNDLLNSPELIEELGIVENQRVKLAKIASLAAKKDHETLDRISADLRARVQQEGLKGDSYRKAYLETAEVLAETRNSMADATVDKFEEILLPAQLKIFRQYGLRSRLKAQTSPFRLLKIAYKRIKMGPNREKEMLDELEAIQARHTKAVEKIREQTIREISQSLGREDSKKVFELIGKRFFPPIK